MSKYEIATKVEKSNALISAMYYSSLQEMKVHALAFSRAQTTPNDGKTRMSVDLFPSEIKQILAGDEHIYRTLKKMSADMCKRLMILEDGNGNFRTFSIVDNCDYIDGVFSIIYNDVVKENTIGLSSNFTQLELSTLLSVSSVSAFRIYELIKMDAFRLYGPNAQRSVKVEYDIYEFRFLIGVANIQHPAIEEDVAKMKVSGKYDWKYLYEKLPADRKAKKYIPYTELDRKVLAPAKKELDEISAVSFDYEKGKTSHNKVESIIFTIKKNVPKKKIAEKTNEVVNQMQFPAQLPEYKAFYEKFVGHNKLDADDLTVLLRDAKMKPEVVEKYINMADSQIHEISNYIGWIRSAIRTKYEEPVPVIRGSAEAAERGHKLVDMMKDPEQRAAATLRALENAKESEYYEEFLKYCMYDSTEEFEALVPEPKDRLTLWLDYKREIFNS